MLSGGSGGLNRLIGGWYTAGIFTASSGVPQIVAQGSGAPYGGGVVSSNPVGEIPIGGAALASGLNRGVFSSQCRGTDYGIGQGQPGGTGLNLFRDPGATACAYRPILLSVDTRSGRDSPLRGLPNWNLDFRLGKETSITERVKVELSADFFNLFNHVVFVDPGGGAAQGGLNLNNASNFGTITTQAIPGNRLAGSRWIEMGLRLSF